jgi:mannose-6-phosphate isomerase-like protein (cupin superfamily)
MLAEEYWRTRLTQISDQEVSSSDRRPAEYPEDWSRFPQISDMDLNREWTRMNANVGPGGNAAFRIEGCDRWPYPCLTMKPTYPLLALLLSTLLLSAQTAPLATSPALAAPAAPKPPAAKLTESLVLDWSELKAEAKPNGERRAAFDNPTETLANFECHVTTLKVGEVSGPAHRHDTDGKIESAILLKDGTVEVSINDRKKMVSAGAVIYFAPKDLVAVANVGKTPAVYFVVSTRAEAAPAPAIVPIAK